MTVRSKQLAQLQSTTDTLSDVYTCPANTRTIVKELVVSSRSGTGFSSQVFISFASGQLTLHRQVVAAYEAYRIVGLWVVLHAGDKISWYRNCSGAAVGGLHLSGAELAL